MKPRPQIKVLICQAQELEAKLNELDYNFKIISEYYYNEETWKTEYGRTKKVVLTHVVVVIKLSKKPKPQKK